MGVTVGVDVGGTKIAAGVVETDGTVRDHVRRETPPDDPVAAVRTIVDAVREVAASDEVDGVGVAAAGFIDKDRSTVVFAPNLGWRNTRLRQEVEAATGFSCVVENDANAAAWGEFRFGGGSDVDDMLLVTVGTGVGGGIVLDGRLYRGGFGVAAEIGHMRVVPGGHLCGCGNHGCFEQYASGRALEREARAMARTGSPQAADLLERAGGVVEQITGPLVTEAAKDGDGLAIELMSDLGRWLGEGIASLTSVLDPTVVVVGGGVADAGALLLDPTREAFRRTLTGRRYRSELEIRDATLGNWAGMSGVADLVRQDPM